MSVPMCPVFGECGGCCYQDIDYLEELSIKEKYVRDLFQELSLSAQKFSSIIPSPEEYHYRNRLDLNLKKTKNGDVFIGFKSNKHNVIEVDTCYIAKKEIGEFFSTLKKEAIDKLTDKYKVANLVVKTDDEGKVFWGGIGRRSLEMKEENYFWTTVCGNKIYYSLDTFFQANLSILPRLFDELFKLYDWDKESIFYDLYGGVGLFGICMSKYVKKVVLIEESTTSLRMAHYNKQANNLSNFFVVEGRVEDRLGEIIDKNTLEGVQAAIIDPPRRGLSKESREILVDMNLNALFYLSCNPETLVRDLFDFVSKGWSINKVIPLDFFPKTKHVEVLVFLDRMGNGY